MTMSRWRIGAAPGRERNGGNSCSWLLTIDLLILNIMIVRIDYCLLLLLPFDVSKDSVDVSKNSADVRILCRPTSALQSTILARTRWHNNFYLRRWRPRAPKPKLHLHDAAGRRQNADAADSDTMSLNEADARRNDLPIARFASKL